ncbi:MAG: DUF4190 domain-containing protein [Phycisphaerae bacterium]|nr:DUF4190 domain-containing protein [Phycisphaerae bacterium]
MEFEIACTCGQNMLVEEAHVGQEVECPGCRQLLTVPGAPRSGDPVPVVRPGPPPPPPPVSARPAPAGPVPPMTPVPIGYGGQYVGPRRTHGKAIAALVLGIAGIVFSGCFPLGIIALILGAQAKRDIREQPELYDGSGLATAGQVCAVISLFICCLFFCVFTISAAFGGHGR